MWSAQLLWKCITHLPGKMKTTNKRVNVILAKFEGHCILRLNITWERHVFNTRNQCDNETIDQYVTDLKKKAQTCEFQNLKDGLIRDRVVCGICCNQTCSRLLKEPDLTLQKAIDICKANEATSKQMKSFATVSMDEKTAIHRIHSDRQLCERCGTGHNKQQLCPAIGAICCKCGHIRTTSPRCATPKPDHSMEYKQMTMAMYQLKYLLAQSRRVRILESGRYNHRIAFKIDTGAQCNVITKQKYLQASKTQNLLHL